MLLQNRSVKDTLCICTLDDLELLSKALKKKKKTRQTPLTAANFLLVCMRPKSPMGRLRACIYL